MYIVWELQRMIAHLISQRKFPETDMWYGGDLS
jgi:hypothetical protein